MLFTKNMLILKRIAWNCYKARVPLQKTFQKISFSSIRVSIEEAKQMPKTYSAISNDTLIIMCGSGDQEAREERLIRDIMSTDTIEWNQAHEKFVQMSAVNCEWMSVATMPYKIGLFSSLFAAGVSIPLIFEINTVNWFNENFVTSDVPDAKDLETFLEVGSWAWNWMEPILGHISFVLICLQFARAQLQNLKWNPYSQYMARLRAKRLHSLFPQYTKAIRKFKSFEPLSFVRQQLLSSDTELNYTQFTSRISVSIIAFMEIPTQEDRVTRG
eukprot:gene11251-23533_t